MTSKHSWEVLPSAEVEIPPSLTKKVKPFYFVIEGGKLPADYFLSTFLTILHTGSQNFPPSNSLHLNSITSIGLFSNCKLCKIESIKKLLNYRNFVFKILVFQILVLILKFHILVVIPQFPDLSFQLLVSRSWFPDLGFQNLVFLC